MNIYNIPRREVVTATGAGDQPAGVPGHHVLRDLHRVELTPGLVEDDPEDDTRVVPSLLHPPAVLQGKVVPELGRDAGRVVHVGDGGEVLPDQEPQSVSPVVPTRALDLDVLPSQ